MYPYDFNPSLRGLNPEEVFVVMPFAPVYDPIYTDLVEPGVRAAGLNLQRPLRAYRTKGDLRTTAGWIEVMEHLFTAQIILGVLTSAVNGNVQYELGIAHATQPICRQVLIAEKDYTPQFDTKDLIFMEYSALSLGDSVEELAARIRTALEGWDVNQETIVRHAIAKLAPFDFEFIMQWYLVPQFSVRTADNGPSEYEQQMAQRRPNDKRFLEGVFQRHCDAIGRLQASGLLALHTIADPPAIKFGFYWTDLGNLVLCHFKLIDEPERGRRYDNLPSHLRRLS
jgi:hypothetical protein